MNGAAGALTAVEPPPPPPSFPLPESSYEAAIAITQALDAADKAALAAGRGRGGEVLEERRGLGGGQELGHVVVALTRPPWLQVGEGEWGGGGEVLDGGVGESKC